jgi:glyoxylase-like metal-dependent hydrolase (beta-lactamase superfamily II)
MRFTDDIYVYEWTDSFENNCNSFYIGGNVNALVDPGLKGYVPNLLGNMEEDGIDKSAIKYVINTHSHPDHFEGSVLFNDADIKVGLHEKEIEFLNGAGSSLYNLFGMDPPVIRIDLPLKEGKISLGDVTFPGHSPGSIGLYWPARKVLFSGDVIFYQNVGRTDFPGGSGSYLKQSIVTLSKLDIETLFPGHMNVIDGANEVKKNFQMVQKHVFPYI